MHSPQILVVDDDLEIQGLLARYMQKQGFRIQLASKCEEVWERIASSPIDLIVLDVMLPDGSGVDLCRDLRATRSAIPIILLTALKEDPRVTVPGIGADDYLGKPFNPRELVASIRAILRRGHSSCSSDNGAGRYDSEGPEAGPSARTVTSTEGGETRFAGADFDLRETLAGPGPVFSRNQMFDLMRVRHDRSINALLGRLRRTFSIFGAAQIAKAGDNGECQPPAKLTHLDEQC